MLAIADHVHTHFPLALVLAHETGHRISSIRQLRWSDIDFENGSIR
jgi:integrase